MVEDWPERAAQSGRQYQHWYCCPDGYGNIKWSMQMVLVGYMIFVGLIAFEAFSTVHLEGLF
jgi:hypothetical protein